MFKVYKMFTNKYNQLKSIKIYYDWFIQMKKSIYIIIILVIGLNAYAVQLIESIAPISRVVIYEQECEVTHTLIKTYQPGEYQIKLLALPVEINDNTVRVSGDGSAEVKIQTIKIETIYQDTTNQKYRILYDSVELYQEQIKAYDDRHGLLKKKADYLDCIKNISTETSATGDEKTKIKPANEWTGLFAFYDSHYQIINNDVRTIGKYKKQLTTKLIALQNRLQKISSIENAIQKNVTVNLQVLKGGNLDLKLSYIIKGASWQPQYDIRVSPEDKSVEVGYYAMIRQQTGEDWNGVKMILSTARPDISGNMPLLSTWYLDSKQTRPRYKSTRDSDGQRAVVKINTSRSGKNNKVTGMLLDAGTNEPLPGAVVGILNTELGANTDINGKFIINNIPAGTYAIKARMMGYEAVTVSGVSLKEGRTADIKFTLLPTALEVEGILILASREIQAIPCISEVENLPTSYVFNTPGENNIPSDGEPHKIPIAFETLKADFEYSSAPRLKQYAYLQGKVKNSTEYPFIAGDINVFFGNNFVGTSAINTVIPSEKFDVSLGIDEGIKITRQKMKDLVENGKRIKRTYGYKITVKNLKKTKEILTVNEQYPVTRNDKIKIKLVSPKFDDEKLEYGIKEKANGLIEWKMELGPQEKKEMELEYILEYPGGVSVTGL